MKMNGVPIKGGELIKISTFSQQTKDCGLGALYELDRFPLQEGIESERGLQGPHHSGNWKSTHWNQKGRIPSRSLVFCLGWVLSGPMKWFHHDSQISINLVSQVILRDNQELDECPESQNLGIRGANEVHEALKDPISCNRERYKVSLPRKGHGPLSTNHRKCLKCLKG